MQIGIAVYSYAKLRLIEFREFINTYLMNDHYQLMECDTDSLYIAFAKANIDESVKPELRDKWLAEKWTWFSSEDRQTMVPFKDQMISLKQFEKRTPGRFKPELGMGKYVSILRYITSGMIQMRRLAVRVYEKEEII